MAALFVTGKTQMDNIFFKQNQRLPFYRSASRARRPATGEVVKISIFRLKSATRSRVAYEKLSLGGMP
jgi:hypothetical protein